LFEIGIVGWDFHCRAGLAVRRWLHCCSPPKRRLPGTGGKICVWPEQVPWRSHSLKIRCGAGIRSSIQATVLRSSRGAGNWQYSGKAFCHIAAIGRARRTNRPNPALRICRSAPAAFSRRCAERWCP
jgi:hypothetical protein